MCYNTSKHNVAETIGFTTFPKTMLLNSSGTNVAKTNDFTTFSQIVLQKPLVALHFEKRQLLKHLAVVNYKNDVAKTIDLQHSQKQIAKQLGG